MVSLSIQMKTFVIVIMTQLGSSSNGINAELISRKMRLINPNQHYELSYLHFRRSYEFRIFPRFKFHMDTWKLGESGSWKQIETFYNILPEIMKLVHEISL